MVERQNSCFPITLEIADEVKQEVTSSPQIISEEKSRIDNGDKELALVLYGIQNGLYVMHDDFAEGAIIAHRIIRRQAEAREELLPILPEGFNVVCMQDYLEDAAPKGFSLEDYLIQEGQALATRDELLFRTLDEIAGSRDGRRIFLGGGAMVAMAYRKYFEGQDLEKIFG